MKNFLDKVISFYGVTITIHEIYHVGFKMRSISPINQSEQKYFCEKQIESSN